MLIDRPIYVDRIMLFRDTDLVKVVTGLRRCGKSSLLELVQARLLEEGIAPHQIASINLESRNPSITTDNELYRYFKEKAHAAEARLYIFVDEVQRIEGWHDVINAMRVDFDCDIYVTGSNAFLLSSEIATYLSGRYVETNVLPLSFSEYLDFCDLTFQPGSSAALSPRGDVITFEDVFDRYLRFGGMPALASLDTTQEQHFQYAKSLYDTVIARDVLNSERHASQRKISDPDLLRRIADFLADNVGNLVSASGIAKYLRSHDENVTDKTASAYCKVLQDAYLFYECRRYDLRGKSLLKTNPKLYLSDLGMRSWLLGGKRSDIGRVFENAVYLQLQFEGYSVQVGKLYQKEVDFVAVHDDKRIYWQVADNVSAEETLERELAPLKAIRDAYPKKLLVRTGSPSQSVEGIEIVSARDFFC